MTNIIKVYKSFQKTRQMFDYYCEINKPHKITYNDMKVTLLTGDNIYFTYTSSLDEAKRKFCAREYQWMELDPDVYWEPEIIGYLQSRIRTPINLLKEFQ